MVRLRTLTLAFLVASSAMVATSRPARAAEMIIEDSGRHRRDAQLDFVGSGWFFGSLTWLGGGAWFAYPIVPDGFIRPWNDSFMLEVGSYVYWYFDDRWVDKTTWLGIIPLAGVRWNFYLTPDWTVFATLKAGVRLRVFGDSYERVGNFAPNASVGAHWRMTEKMHLRLEVGNFGIAQVGVSIQL